MANLSPPPMSHVLVGPGEAHYYAQYGGSQPLSVAPMYESTYTCQVYHHKHCNRASYIWQAMAIITKNEMQRLCQPKTIYRL